MSAVPTATVTLLPAMSYVNAASATFVTPLPSNDASCEAKRRTKLRLANSPPVAVSGPSVPPPSPAAPVPVLGSANSIER